MLLLLGMLVGAVVPVQAAMNTRLRQAIGSPIAAALVSFTVAVAFSSALAFASTGELFPSLAAPTAEPWWIWLGGVLGACFVYGGAAISPSLGTGTTVIAMLVGNIVCGQVLESLGVGAGRRGMPTLYRFAGLATVLIGVAMVRLL